MNTHLKEVRGINSLIKTLREKAKKLKSELYTLYLVGKHPKTPWYVKGLALVLLAYAISPIDLIPDFIPLLGFIDDIILLPMGIYLVFKLIPEEILIECREETKQKVPLSILAKWITVTVIIVIWITILGGIGYWAIAKW